MSTKVLVDMKTSHTSGYRRWLERVARQFTGLALVIHGRLKKGSYLMRENRSAKWLTVLAALLCVSTLTHGQQDLQKAKQDLVSAWLVTVEGESKTRTLLIRGISQQPSGVLVLDATYGWTNGSQNLARGEATATPNGYKLQLTTPAESVITAELSDGEVFVGSFTDKKGVVKSVQLQKVSDEELKKQSRVAAVPSPQNPCHGSKTVDAHASTVSTETRSLQRPQFLIGDCWVFQTTDLWKNEETQIHEYRVAAVGGDNIEFTRTVHSSKTAADVGRPSKRKADAATLSFVDARIIDGAYVALNFPLEVGKTWRYSFKKSHQSGNPTIINTTAKVVGWETVKVPAGEFRALKVVHNGHWNRIDSTGNLGGVMTESYWYSPEVKWWVKYEYHDQTTAGRTWDQFRREAIEVNVAK